ncbi:hypothetical protein M3Y95_00459000 [Aphelenchoides besseyi]|nr:hypothetical protein M3Y95_00459000 [Aphelenchoides besseyi]
MSKLSPQQPSTSSVSAVPSNAVVVRKAMKAPILSAENRPVKLKETPRVMLDEEDFTNKLTKIIERDYFPELAKLRAQREYFDAVADNDVEKIRELQLRYTSDLTKGSNKKPTRRFNLNEKRFDVDTEMEEVVVNPEGQNDEEEAKKSEVVDVDKHTVQTFVNTYISEDSKSFHDLMEYEDKKHRTKYDLFAKAEERHNAELIERAKPMICEADRQLIERKEPEDNRPSEIDNWSYKARNALLYEPEGATPTLKEFMEAVKCESQKTINKAGTRIDTKTLNWDKKTNASNQFAVAKVDISGEELDPRSKSAQQFAPLPTPDPTLQPGDSPFITWGSIDGTPFRLDAADMTPLPDHIPTFKMPEMTKREIIAHGMVDKLKQQNREKKKFSQKMTEKLRNPHTRLSSVSRFSMMSPAAHRFAQTKLGIKTKNTGISKKTPASVRLQPPSVRPTPRADHLQVPTTSVASDAKLEPMESVINENLLSVRKQKHQFH